MLVLHEVEIKDVRNSGSRRGEERHGPGSREEPDTKKAALNLTVSSGYRSRRQCPGRKWVGQCGRVRTAVAQCSVDYAAMIAHIGPAGYTISTRHDEEGKNHVLWAT
jgi:hypothetical protein